MCSIGCQNGKNRDCDMGYITIMGHGDMGQEDSWKCGELEINKAAKVSPLIILGQRIDGIVSRSCCRSDSPLNVCACVFWSEDYVL